MGTRRYKHMTEKGGFDERAHATAQAQERQKRGNVTFTRAEKFNEVMSGSAQSNERKAKAHGLEHGFRDKYDSALGKARRSRRSGGHIGSGSY